MAGKRWEVGEKEFLEERGKEGKTFFLPTRSTSSTSWSSCLSTMTTTTTTMTVIMMNTSSKMIPRDLLAAEHLSMPPWLLPSFFSYRQGFSNTWSSLFLEIISIKNFPNIFRCSVTIAQFPGSPSRRLASFAQLEQPPGFCSGEGPPLLCGHRLEDRLLLDDIEHSWSFLDIVHIYAALMDRRRVKTIITSSDHFEAKNSGGCDHQGHRRRPGGGNGKKGRYLSENMGPCTFRAWSHVLLCCKSYFGTIVRCQNQWLCMAIHPSEMQVRMCRCA